MKKFVAASLAAFFMLWSFAPLAVAHQRETSWTHRILHDYYSVVRKLGKQAAGRDIIHHGVNTKAGPKDPTKHQKAKFQRQLRKLLHPPTLMYTRAVPPQQAPAGTLSAFHVAGLPECTWKGESGGSYTATNGPYWGKYQIHTDHWNTVCRGLGMGPEGQEECAVRVYQSEGIGAWSLC